MITYFSDLAMHRQTGVENPGQFVVNTVQYPRVGQHLRKTQGHGAVATVLIAIKRVFWVVFRFTFTVTFRVPVGHARLHQRTHAGGLMCRIS